MLATLACVSGAFFSTFKDLFSKSLASRIDGSVSTFASFAFAIPFYLLILAVMWLSGTLSYQLSASFWIYVVLRSLTDSAAEWCKMHALAKGDLSLLANFLALAPAFALVISPLVTGDIPSVRGVLGVLIVVIGSILLVPTGRDKSSDTKLSGILLALCSSFFFSLNHCLDRLAVQQGSPVWAGFAMTLFSAIILAPNVFNRQKLSQMRAEKNRLILRGFGEVSYMTSKLYALTFLQAPYVAAILRLSTLFSIVSAKILFKEEEVLKRLLISALTVVGTIIILSE